MARVVLPGDVVLAAGETRALRGKGHAVRVGPGLRQCAAESVPEAGDAGGVQQMEVEEDGGGVVAGDSENVQIVAMKCGTLRHKAPAAYWVDSSQKRVS
jgi:hypothetical protein